ncbi:hypothetical protein AB5I41_11895 [Sphingomonas sp. MMS24-JH45]
MKTRFFLALAGAAFAVVAAAPATAQRDWDWRAGDYRLVGAGVSALFPELRRDPRGRAWVMRNFDRNRDGRVQPREALAANDAFVALAGREPPLRLAG